MHLVILSLYDLMFDADLDQSEMIFICVDKLLEIECSKVCSVYPFLCNWFFLTSVEAVVIGTFVRPRS